MDSFKHKVTMNKIETKCLKLEIERQMGLAKQHAIPMEQFTPDERNKHYAIIIGAYHQGRLEALESVMDHVI